MANFICAGDGINKTARSVRKTQTARFCMGMDRGDIGATRGRRKEERPTQSRKRVKGGLRPFSFAPCRVKGQRPLWGLGQRPNCSAGDQYAKRAQQRRRQRSVPASNFALPQERPQPHIRPLTYCRARWARPTSMGNDLFSRCWSFLLQEVSPLRRRIGGFAVAPDAPSHCTSMFLDFSRCRGNRACGGDKGAFRSPP